MLRSDSPTGKYGIITRLFSLIGSLPRNRQLILMKQLVGDKVTAHLFKMIVEMSENQQLILLEHLEHSMGAEPIEKTLRLEDNEPSMRESPRKPCLVSANYKIRDEDIRSYILDISIGGVFIETKDPLKIGEAVVITFNLPDSVEPFSVRGAVAWSGPTGFGVKFDPLVPSQGKTIRQYIGIP